MPVFLGIDTGGTFTDAVLLNTESGIIATAKALTTKHDLSVGIENAVQAVRERHPLDVQLVSLSTTLATNAIVERQGSPVCLLLIGYDPSLLSDLEVGRVLPRDSIVFIRGGHTVTGEEQAPLDVDAARQAILAQAPAVAAFAVSGYFGVRNPTHELEVRRLVRNLTGLPVTCGHELSTRLHAPRRALTAALNARLIPMLQHLIMAVRSVLAKLGLRAPLMVVKGDGSLVGANMALERPVETILSGPAASVVGAHFLTKVGDGFVIDMGGTTTDIAALHDGQPRLSIVGARVGEWQTMVEAVDVQTTGLGGDSEVQLDSNGSLSIGPRRVIPLCLLGEQHPEILESLRRETKRLEDGHGSPPSGTLGCFVLWQGPQQAEQVRLSPSEQKVWEQLRRGPTLLSDLLRTAKYSPIYQRVLEDLLEHGYIVASAFTPTDAIRVLGRFHMGSIVAANLGAGLWSRRLGIGVEQFCEQVVEQVGVQAGRALITGALAGEGFPSPAVGNGVGVVLIDRALGADRAGSFDVAFSMRQPLVAIGAPAPAYLPALATRLHAQLTIPPHAAVASAVGAVAGGVVQTVRVLIRPLTREKCYRVHLPDQVRDFPTLEEAAACAEAIAGRLAEEQARLAGAGTPRVRVERHDRKVPAGAGSIGDLYLETEVVATAAGRPRLGS